MKTTTIVFYLMSLLLFIPAAQAQLKIDFTQAGGPVEVGYEGYFAGHENPATFTAQSYSAFGATITVTPSWVPGATAAAMQMIDRGGNDGEDTPDLMRDWIGTDNRQVGDPMTLTISGLPAGTYRWLSYHHDTDNQTGTFDVTVNDAAGSTTTTNIDITDLDFDGVTTLAGAAKFTTDIVSDGSDISLVFDVTSGTSPVSVAFFVMSGFILEAQNPCYNLPPAIQGPDVLSVYVGESIVINVTVTDDGKPYIEGCNPDEPETGTPYGLEYLWLQHSGPAPVQFEPVSADVEDPNVVFQLAGTYELMLEVSDGPVGPGQEDGKMTEFLVTVEVLRPLDGDIDRTGTVDYLDFQILAYQWLDSPACLEGAYCADLDDSGSVTANDFALLSSNWQIESTKVLINEFVASNRRSLLDGDGGAPDWIELHNSGTEAVSLNGWHLADEKENLEKWPFPPETVLPAGGYLVVFASDQPADDYVDAGGYLHTNFAINKGGDYLALVNPAGRVMHEYAPEFPPQETDISYGMWFTLFRYFAVPTPGKANEQAFMGFTDKPSHSHSRGFYDAPFSLWIFCDTPDAFIRYTLDGSEPTEQYGIMYDRNTPIPITTTTHVRSAAFKPGWKSADVTTHTYIFVDDVARQPANPPGWPSDWGYSSDAGAIVPADYEMDPRVVNNTQPGYSVRDALLDIPTVSISMLPDDFISDPIGIYANPQSRWERKCSVEYIFPDNTTGFQHDCKIEIHGNASRRPYRMQKHSLRLTFTSLYGPAKLNYPLFGESGVDEFNQLVLRATFTDSWGLVSWSSSRYRPNDSQYIRDVWMKESLGDMGQPSSRGNFVHLYVNGLYFGIHNLTERLADDFFAIRLGGEPEDWEINADFSTRGSRWNAMMSINPATLAGYTQIQNYLDVENFADYMLLHFYADSEDWPHHNGYAAANAISGDGKFRFFVWDQEIVIDYHGRGASRIDSTGGAGAVFQKMRTSEEFRLLFADRVHKHYFNGGALSATGSGDRYLKVANWIDKAIVAESARWGDTQMSTPYGNTIQQPSPLNDINHNLYPPAPNGPDYYFTREDSWIVERDNVVNNYIPAIHNTANSYAIINVLRAENLYPDIDSAVFYINGTYQHGGYISTGDLLTMTNPNGTGTIYYTLDGSDPRVPASSDPGSTHTLVKESAPKKVLVPTGNIGSDWTGGNEPYDELGWTAGTGGVGYETQSGYKPYFSIDVIAMRNSNETCYIRIPFAVAAQDLSWFNYMSLNVRYDDGFAAYINGVKVYQTLNAPSTLMWNSGASESHDDSAAKLLDNFDISSHLSLLQGGDNILAIHGLNYQTTSTDFLISAELVAGDRGSMGGVSENARPYSAPVALQYTRQVKARVLNGSQWSALNEAIYAAGPVKESLRINEIMYHPKNTGDANDPNEEYIELKNISSETININLVKFTNGIDFTFPSWELGKKNCVLVVKDRAAFDAQYPGLSSIIAGEYTGSLDNGGERIELADAVGRTIQDFKYGDDWRPISDGEGFSLTIIDPANPDPNSWGEKDSWRASAYSGGSPGSDDSGILPDPGAVVINELLAHSPGTPGDWIELYNTTGAWIDIGGWYLSDSAFDLKKYRITDGTEIEAYGYTVFYEDVNFGEVSTDLGKIVGFALSENEGAVYLSSAEGGVLMGYREAEDFGASEMGVSFGRYFKRSTGNYNFVAMSVATPWLPNAYPKVGPIVINEIMYNPQSVDQRQEYIELHNIGPTDITLYDPNEAQPWRFTDGIEYTFPPYPGATIPAGGYLLVVKDMTAYLAQYGLPPFGVPVLGPYDAKLSNGGEKLELSMPGDTDEYGTQRYYIRVDRVNYSDGSHPQDCPGGVDLWPTDPDAGGKSLTRTIPANYGNDPNNWTAATPSPGE